MTFPAASPQECVFAFFCAIKLTKPHTLKMKVRIQMFWHSLNFTLALSVVLLRCVAGSLTVTHLSVMGEREVRLN